VLYNYDEYNIIEAIYLGRKTPITITVETKKLLDKAKKIFGGRTYNDTIHIILNKVLSIPESMFGIDRNRISEFREEDRLFRDEE